MSAAKTAAAKRKPARRKRGSFYTRPVRYSPKLEKLVSELTDWDSTLTREDFNKAAHICCLGSDHDGPQRGTWLYEAGLEFLGGPRPQSAAPAGPAVARVDESDDDCIMAFNRLERAVVKANGLMVTQSNEIGRLAKKADCQRHESMVADGLDNISFDLANELRQAFEGVFRLACKVKKDNGEAVR